MLIKKMKKNASLKDRIINVSDAIFKHCLDGENYARKLMVELDERVAKKIIYDYEIEVVLWIEFKCDDGEYGEEEEFKIQVYKNKPSIYTDTKNSWEIECGFDFEITPDDYICYVIHELIAHMHYTPKDVADIVDVSLNVEVLHNIC